MLTGLYNTQPTTFPNGMAGLGVSTPWGTAFWDDSPAPIAAPSDIDLQQAEGIRRFEVARSLVSLDYCKQLACGVVQQREAGPEKVAACGLVYPMQPQAWCSDFCAPWLPQLQDRYGATICGGLPPPPEPTPILPLPALPEIIQSVPVPQEALPEVLRPSAVTFLDEVSCPSCESDCAVRIGNCCLTRAQVLALAGLFVLAVVY